MEKLNQTWTLKKKFSKILELLGDTINYGDIVAISQEENYFEIEFENGAILKLPLKGSDDIVVDISEDNNTLELHIDNDLKNKIIKSLQLPMSNPTDLQAVGVGINGAQEMFSANRLVRHNVKISYGTAVAYLEFYNSQPTVYDNLSDVKSGYISKYNTQYVKAIGVGYNNYPIISAKFDEQYDNLEITIYNTNNNTTETSLFYNDTATVEDTSEIVSLF